MSKLNQKIELAANFLIIIAAFLLCGVIVQKYFFDKSTAATQPECSRQSVNK
jgi:hypothetical protein